MSYVFQQDILYIHIKTFQEKTLHKPLLTAFQGNIIFLTPIYSNVESFPAKYYITNHYIYTWRKVSSGVLCYLSLSTHMSKAFQWKIIFLTPIHTHVESFYVKYYITDPYIYTRWKLSSQSSIYPGGKLSRNICIYTHVETFPAKPLYISISKAFNRNFYIYTFWKLSREI